MRQVLWLFPLVLLLVVGFTSPTFADPDDLDVIVIFKKGTPRCSPSPARRR